MAIHATLIGDKRLKMKMNKMVYASKEGLEDGIHNSSELAKTVAQKNAPIRTGNLRTSAYVVSKGKDIPTGRSFANPPENDLAKLRREDGIKLQEAMAELPKDPSWKGSEIGFTTYYAIYLHEGLKGGTITQYSGGSWKFLEKAMSTAKAWFIPQIKTSYLKHKKGI